MPRRALLDNVLGVLGSLGECPEGEGGVLTVWGAGPRPGREYISINGCASLIVRGTHLSSLIILALFIIGLVGCGVREPVIKGKSGVKM